MPTALRSSRSTPAAGRWARLVGTAVLTFTALLVAALVLPIVVGKARSGGAAGTQALHVLGLDVVTVETDGSGGFSSTYGPGVVLLPLLAAALVAAAGAVGIAVRR